MATSQKKRTLTPEQKAKMSIGRARADARAAGMPDPFPEQPTAPQQPIAPIEQSPLHAAAPVADSVAQKDPELVHYGPHDIVRVFNPDNQDFSFRYGTKAQYDAKQRVIESSIEPIMYTLPAGKAIPMYGYMADYVCNHLTSRILQKLGQVRQLNSPIVRKAWAAKIILGKEDIITPEAKLSEAEQVRRQFDKIQAADNPVTDDENEIPLAEADALLGDIDQDTLKEAGEFPDANPDPLTA